MSTGSFHAHSSVSIEVFSRPEYVPREVSPAVEFCHDAMVDKAFKDVA
jgi:hypothetical protein